MIMAVEKDRSYSLASRPDSCEYPNIAVIPIAAERAVGCQFVIAEPFSTKVSDLHAAGKMEESKVRADRNSAGMQVVQLR
jgi:hypothetical protein